jgi:cysteine dioxygenase
MKTLEELIDFAKDYQFKEEELPISFTGEPYTRTPIYKDEELEIVVICFAKGQTSSVHDHQGSNCVVRVVRGKLLETLFAEEEGGLLGLQGNHLLFQGHVSGLDGVQVHQLVNLDPSGSVLLNFYSPPFKT